MCDLPRELRTRGVFMNDGNRLRRGEAGAARGLNPSLYPWALLYTVPAVPVAVRTYLLIFQTVIKLRLGVHATLLPAR